MSTLRYATTADIPALISILDSVFQEQISEAYLESVLEHGRNKIWVVEQDEQAVGFVSGFLTKINTAIRRWEVDLLAVQPTYWGNQYGSELLKKTLQDARNHRANFSRGLVRVENKPAQWAFRLADFHTTGQIYQLMVWQPRDLGEPLPEDETVSLIPVKTLTYSGIWMEGLNAPYLSAEERWRYISGARTLAAQENYRMVSSLIPAKYELEAEIAAESEVVGEYQWWRRP